MAEHGVAALSHAPSGERVRTGPADPSGAWDQDHPPSTATTTQESGLRENRTSRLSERTEEGGKPDLLRLYTFGRGAWNCRLTQSSGHGAALSLIVVRTGLPRTAPCRPMARISRATVQRTTLIPSLSPDLPNAVDAEVRLIHAPDLDHQRCIPPGARGQPLRISPPSGVGVIGRRGDWQHPADRLDPVDGAMLVDKGDHGLDRRSSSAIAKYADALRRISLACRNSRTSRSSARMRSCSAVVGPARRP